MKILKHSVVKTYDRAGSLFEIVDKFCNSKSFVVRVLFRGTIYKFEVPRDVYRSCCDALYHPSAHGRYFGIRRLLHYVESVLL